MEDSLLQPSHAAAKDPDGFPWHLGVFDAHCHPTDTLDGLPGIPKMKARVLTIMATREQDQELVSNAYVENGLDVKSLGTGADAGSSPCQILPAFGWHPWFSHQMYDDTDGVKPGSKLDHYKNVLTPEPEEGFVAGLPEPKSLSSYIERTREYLEKHPAALVGEIGLDRSMRIPENTTEGRAVDPEPGLTPGGRENRRLSPYKVDMKHQQKILLAQLKLAGEMERAVSVHGVAAHGMLYDTLQSTWKGHERTVVGKRAQQRMHPDDLREMQARRPGPKPYPPRICLHSYSGPPGTIKQYLHPSVPADIFFSFSQVVNFLHGSNKALDAIKVIPDDRILIESDLHRAGEQMDDLLVEIAQVVCDAKGWKLEEGIRQLAMNWKAFALATEEDHDCKRVD